MDTLPRYLDKAVLLCKDCKWRGLEFCVCMAFDDPSDPFKFPNVSARHEACEHFKEVPVLTADDIAMNDADFTRLRDDEPMNTTMDIQQEGEWCDRAQHATTPDEYKRFIRATMGRYNTMMEDVVQRDGHFFCRDCATHEQRSNEPATHFAHGDCKNLIGTVERYKDGRWIFITKTQCACQGPAHGVRKGWY